MNEVLSRSIGIKKISRITLGALEDMGYVVNYTAADPYGIDDVGSGCSVCPENIQVRRRRTEDTPLPSPKSSCHPSGEAYDASIQRGYDLYRVMHASHGANLKLDALPDGVVYAGNHRGLVTYHSEDGTLCSTKVPLP